MIYRTQLYRTEETFTEYSGLNNLKVMFDNFCLIRGKWGKIGRCYDVIMSIYFCDMSNKIVAELGARDCMFSPFITNIASKVYTSDYFKGWGDLGSLEYWTNLWKGYAYDPERMVCEYQDMTKLTYASNSFDIVTSFSAIEHTEDDITAAKEIGRILKPGGTAIIGTDFKEVFDPNTSSRFYTEKTFIERIVIPSGLVLDEKRNLDWCGPIPGHPFNCGILFLRKD